MAMTIKILNISLSEILHHAAITKCTFNWEMCVDIFIYTKLSVQRHSLRSEVNTI